MLTRSEDIDTLAVVREVCTFVTKSGSTDSNSVLSSGRRVVASITVVVA